MKRGHWLRLHAIAFALLFAACLAALGWLSDRHAVSWQWAGAQTRLTEASLRLLAQLDAPVQAVVFVTPGHFLERHVQGLLARYAAHAPDFTWEFVNPEARPDLVRRLGVQGAGEVVLEYKGRREQVTVPTEAYISAALERLHRGAGQRIGYLTGHGERRLTGEANYDLGAFGRALAGKGYQLQALNLASGGGVPEEIDLLLVAGPQTDLLAGELRALERFVQDGGNLLWLAEPEDAQRLDTLAQALGVHPQPGVLVDPQAGELLGVDDPRLLLLEEYPSHPVTARLQAPSLLPHAIALGLSADAPWQVEPLLVASPRHRQVLDFETKAVELPPPREGERLLLGIALTRESGHQGGRQRVAVIGDGDFVSNTYIGNGANLQLGLNLVDWLTESEVFLDLYAQAAPDQRLELAKGEIVAIGFGFLFGLPLAFLGVGVWCWWRRRSG